ncbi:MAG TPA: hypothetical protein VHV77_03610 [Pirellulales bacterium]|jgi:hypothetical protein|nr:hypothetical protein [Pirellulales bacterium]
MHRPDVCFTPQGFARGTSRSLPPQFRALSTRRLLMLMPIETCTNSAPFWIAGLGIFFAAMFVRTFPAVRGTTLVGVWTWSTAALIALLGMELAAWARPAQHWIDAGRYAAAILSLAPFVSVLGAKRPQHRAWQLVVLTLVAVLVLPALQSTLLHPGARIQVHAAMGVFLVALLLVEFVNYALTRYLAPILLIVAGQGILLGPFLPWLRWSAEGANALFAMTVLALGLLAAVVIRGKRRGAGRDRVWVAFCDAYGLLWGMRVAERFNHETRARGESEHVTWRGRITNASTTVDSGSPSAMQHEKKSSTESAAPADIDGVAMRRLSALLLRFVSKQWIARHFDEP